MLLQVCGGATVMFVAYEASLTYFPYGEPVLDVVGVTPVNYFHGVNHYNHAVPRRDITWQVEFSHLMARAVGTMKEKDGVNTHHVLSRIVHVSINVSFEDEEHDSGAAVHLEEETSVVGRP